jgi:hypothetical protein
MNSPLGHHEFGIGLHSFLSLTFGQPCYVLSVLGCVLTFILFGALYMFSCIQHMFFHNHQDNVD